MLFTTNLQKQVWDSNWIKIIRSAVLGSDHWRLRWHWSRNGQPVSLLKLQHLHCGEKRIENERCLRKLIIKAQSSHQVHSLWLRISSVYRWLLENRRLTSQRPWPRNGVPQCRHLLTRHLLPTLRRLYWTHLPHQHITRCLSCQSFAPPTFGSLTEISHSRNLSFHFYSAHSRHDSVLIE